MKLNKNSQSVLIIFLLVTLIGFGVVVISLLSVSRINRDLISNNVSLVQGKQIVSINVNSEGYSPTLVNLQANVPTVLKFNSISAFGCERFITIPQLGIRKTLPTNGIIEINIEAQQSGTSLLATCSMGMYDLTLNYI